MVNKWAAELVGDRSDKKIWKQVLASEFDPYVEEIVHGSDRHCVLRSTEFTGCENAKEVFDAASSLVSILNVTITQTTNSRLLKVGSVFDLASKDEPKRTVFAEGIGITARVGGGAVSVVVTDKNGNVIEPHPTPSKAQRWVHASILEPEIGKALKYLEGHPSWVELYKAYEAIRNMPCGNISKAEISRFTQTANVGNRHHMTKKSKPHKSPMNLSEGYTLITRWIEFAIEDVLEKNPPITQRATLSPQSATSRHSEASHRALPASQGDRPHP
jgi:hypothetical protein